MTYWIVRGKDDRTDWDRVLRPGENSTWYTFKPTDRLRPGDRLFLYRPSPHFELVGLAEVKRLHPPDRDGEYRVGLTALTPRLSPPVSRAALRADPVIADSAFLKSGPAGTFLRLEDEQAERMFALVVEAHPVHAKLGWADPAGGGVEHARLSPEGTRGLFERFSARPMYRDAAARALAESILTAHAASPSSWSVTLHEGLLRLNVGMPYVLNILADGRFTLVVQDTAACRRVRQRFGAKIAATDQTPFSTAPGAVPFEGHAEVFADFYEAMLPFHVAAIHNAVAHRESTPHKGFSPGVIAYLHECGLAVPRPIRPADLPQTAQEIRDMALSLMLPDFDPTRLKDERKRVLAEVARRDGQEAFRQKLLALYGGRCAVTHCDVEEALEAAHIHPFRGRKTNDVRNGLILRADIHKLFDRGLLTVTPDYVVRLRPELKQTEYAQYEGRVLRVPEQAALQPHRQALAERHASLDAE